MIKKIFTLFLVSLAMYLNYVALGFEFTVMAGLMWSIYLGLTNMFYLEELKEENMITNIEQSDYLGDDE